MFLRFFPPFSDENFPEFALDNKRGGMVDPIPDKSNLKNIQS